MAYASRSGRARTSAVRPQAFAVCDRCGIWHNRSALQFQFQWRGTTLQNLWILVCRHCLDVPQEQLRAITLPADPTPIWQPRVEAFDAAETDYRTTLPTQTDPVTGLPVPAQSALRVTQDSQNRITQPIGCPEGLEQAAVMPYNGGIQKAFGKLLNVLSVVSNGTGTVQVTCYTPHGLQTNDQVSIEGLSARAANGFFSVTVLSATAFTYRCVKNIQDSSWTADSLTPTIDSSSTTIDSVGAGSLLTSTTRIITALVGLPYGSVTIPQPDCCPGEAVEATSGGVVSSPWTADSTLPTIDTSQTTVDQ